jgi:hypothetical protein
MVSDDFFRARLKQTLIAATLFVLFFSTPHAGFMAILPAIPFLCWTLFQFITAVRHPDMWKIRVIRVGLWWCAFALVAGIHVWRDQDRRARADAIVAKIEAYQAQHGTCPPTLKAIGERREGLGFSYYACEKNEPSLFYAVPYIIYETYHYDFRQKTWTHLGG